MPIGGIKDISIAITAKDDYTDTIKRIAGYNDKLAKSFTNPSIKLERLSGKLTEFQKRQGEMKASVSEAKKAMKEYTAAFEKSGKAADENKAKLAAIDYANQRRNLNLVTRQMKETERAMQDLAASTDGIANKTDAAGDSMQRSFGKSIAASGAVRELGSALTAASDAFVKSAFGDRSSTMVSSIIGGATSGAASLAFLGLPAMAAGAAIGGVGGAISGASQNFEKEDQVFKGYVQEMYESTKSGIADGIGNGSTTAGHREQTQMAFAQRFGSDEEANAYLARVKTMAVQSNYDYDEIAGYSKKLLNTYDSEQVFGVIRDLSDASAGLDLDSSDVEMFINGLSRMRTTGKTTQEYLNYFGERGIDTYEALSRATGIGRNQIPDAVRNGEIKGDTAADAILAFIQSEFGGLSDKLAGSYDAVAANLEDAKKNVEAGYGEGYNDKRKVGMQAETEAYTGALGDAVTEMNKTIGASQAYMDNHAADLKTEALAALTLGKKTSLYGEEQASRFDEIGTEYERLQKELFAAKVAGDEERVAEIGGIMGSLKTEAESMATAAYDNSDIVQKSNDIELDTIEALNALTKTLSGGVEFIVRKEDALSMGQKRVGSFSSRSDVDGSILNPNRNIYTGGDSRWKSNQKEAWGLPLVPRDDFPALLHAGERVLTANQARQADRADSGVMVNVSGNQFTIREEADIDKIAAELAEQIRLARMKGLYAKPF